MLFYFSKLDIHTYLWLESWTVHLYQHIGMCDLVQPLCYMYLANVISMCDLFTEMYLCSVICVHLDLHMLSVCIYG